MKLKQILPNTSKQYVITNKNQSSHYFPQKSILIQQISTTLETNIFAKIWTCRKNIDIQIIKRIFGKIEAQNKSSCENITIAQGHVTEFRAQAFD